MYTATHAIIMAAGRGERLRPLTSAKPKPLVSVGGVPMIETIISALHANGITEIYIVTGYKKEQFEPLAARYDGITLIENPDFDRCNNISSMYVARHHLPGAIVLDGDQVVVNADILNPEFERSGYCCAWSEGHTDEWLLRVEDEVVTGCSRVGGEGGWQLYSVSFWSEADGARLAADIESEYIECGNNQVYWDDVALLCRPQNYQLGIRQVSNDDIAEIDSMEDLARFEHGANIA